jgi:hypothetical protein
LRLIEQGVIALAPAGQADAVTRAVVLDAPAAVAPAQRPTLARVRAAEQPVDCRLHVSSSREALDGPPAGPHLMLASVAGGI